MTVNDSQNLQNVINRVQEGGVLCLQSGEWQENVKIEKALTLRGLGVDKSIVQGIKRNLPVIWVTGSATVTVRIEELQIKGPGLGMLCLTPGRYGVCASNVHVEGSARLSMANALLDGNYAVFSGLDLLGKSQAEVASTTITKVNNWALYVEQSSQLKLTDSNIVENKGMGLSAGGSAQIEMTRSTIARNSDGLLNTGIWVTDSTRLSVSDSVISENAHTGINIEDSVQVTLERNKISDNLYEGVFVYVQGCGGLGESYKFSGKVSGKENQISNNKRGDFCPSNLSFLTTSQGGSYP